MSPTLKSTLLVVSCCLFIACGASSSKQTNCTSNSECSGSTTCVNGTCVGIVGDVVNDTAKPEPDLADTAQKPEDTAGTDKSPEYDLLDSDSSIEPSDTGKDLAQEDNTPVDTTDSGDDDVPVADWEVRSDVEQQDTADLSDQVQYDSADSTMLDQYDGSSDTLATDSFTPNCGKVPTFGGTEWAEWAKCAQKCTQASDCTRVQIGCCGCSGNGKPIPLHKDLASAYNKRRSESCGIGTICSGAYLCDDCIWTGKLICDAGRCATKCP